MLTKTTKPKAQAVLKLLAKELRARGHKVELPPLDRHGFSSPLAVDGVDIRLAFKEVATRVGHGGSLRGSGKLLVTLFGLHRDLPTVNFRSARARAQTHGLDVPCMCDKVEAWLNFKSAQNTREEKEQAAYVAAVDAKERLLAEHPTADAVLRTSRRGLLFEAVVTEDVARQLLKVYTSLRSP